MATIIRRSRAYAVSILQSLQCIPPRRRVPSFLESIPHLWLPRLTRVEKNYGGKHGRPENKGLGAANEPSLLASSFMMFRGPEGCHSPKLRDASVSSM